MLAGIGEAGDNAGDPLLTIANGQLRWVDEAKTKLRGTWTAGEGIDLAGTDHAVKYINGAIVDRAHGYSYIFTVPTPGIVPDIAVVFIPAICDDGVYDPLNGANDPTIENMLYVPTVQRAWTWWGGAFTCARALLDLLPRRRLWRLNAARAR